MEYFLRVKKESNPQDKKKGLVDFFTGCQNLSGQTERTKIAEFIIDALLDKLNNDIKSLEEAFELL